MTFPWDFETPIWATECEDYPTFVGSECPPSGDPVDGTASGYCPYVSGGKVRRLVSEVTGARHLEGETVKVVADGAVQNEQIVEDGRIPVSPPAGVVILGINYKSKLRTMRLEGGSPMGTAQGKQKRIFEIVVRVLNSIGFRIGPSEDKVETVEFRNQSDPMDTPVPLFTGDKKLSFPGEFESDGYIFIEQDQPLPLTILAIMPKVEVNDT